MSKQYSDDQNKFLNQKFTLKGRILFPNLLTMKKKTKPEDRDVYDVMFAWFPQENAQTMGLLSQWLQHATAMFHQGCNPAALQQPIKDFNTYVRQDATPNPDYLKGQLWVNASTGKDYPPQVVKQVPGMGLVRLKSPEDDAEVYSGRNAVITISFWPLFPKPGAQNQKRGFSVNVDAVLLLDGGEVVGGAPSVDVNQVFGAFVQDMGMAPAFGQFGQAPAQPAQQPVQHQAPAQPAWNQPAQQPVQHQAPAQPAWNQPAQQPSNLPPMGQPAAPAWNGQGQMAAPPMGPQGGQQPMQHQAQPSWPPAAPAQQGPAQPAWNGQPTNFGPNGQYNG